MESSSNTQAQNSSVFEQILEIDNNLNAFHNQSGDNNWPSEIDSIEEIIRDTNEKLEKIKVNPEESIKWTDEMRQCQIEWEKEYEERCEKEKVDPRFQLEQKKKKSLETFKQLFDLIKEWELLYGLFMGLVNLKIANNVGFLYDLMEPNVSELVKYIELLECSAFFEGAYSTKVTIIRTLKTLQAIPFSILKAEDANILDVIVDLEPIVIKVNDGFQHPELQNLLKSIDENDGFSSLYF